MEKPETKYSLSVPETLEGWAALHTVFEMNWTKWKEDGLERQNEALAEVKAYVEKVAKPEAGSSALFSVLGHKGDLLLLHFRNTFDELSELEVSFRKLRLADYLKATTSYVSFVELGMYEMTVKLHQEFMKLGMDPESDEWKAKWRTAFEDQRERMGSRVYPTIPDNRYLCFYPMDKKRGETRNWYEIPIEKRQTMMRDHGMIGRKYSGQVTQIITGSIGYDDWEWGVYLFADNPLVYKKLIYEMRFDEASAAYALFGTFYTGLRILPDKLTDFFHGKVR